MLGSWMKNISGPQLKLRVKNELNEEGKTLKMKVSKSANVVCWSSKNEASDLWEADRDCY